MLVLLEKDGPARVAAGRVGPVGTVITAWSNERSTDAGSHTYHCRYASGLAMSHKIDDGKVTLGGLDMGTDSRSGLQPGTGAVTQPEETRSAYLGIQSSAEQPAVSQCSQSV